MIEFAKAGRIAAQRVDAPRKRSETQLRHKAAQQAWSVEPKPSWLTPEFYDRDH
jgi:hypothetical protein